MTVERGKLIVRAARYEDAQAVWEIRSDPQSRSVSGSSDQIPLPNHLDWFRQRYFEHPTPNLCFIGEVDGWTAAYCRLDWDESCLAFVVSIAMRPCLHGRGLGYALLSRALEMFFKSRNPAPEVIACIKPENIASISLFKKAGFADCGDSRYRFVLSKHALNQHGALQ